MLVSNELQINTTLENSLGDDYHLFQITNEGDYGSVDGAVSMDSRMSPEIVSSPLAFDPHRLTGIAFGIRETASTQIIGVGTVLISPQKLNQEERYLIPCDGGRNLMLSNTFLTNGSFHIPSFTIIPGWAHVLREHRGIFSQQGLGIYIDLIHQMEGQAPEDTWVALNPPGPYDKDLLEGKLGGMIDRLGSKISLIELESMIGDLSGLGKAHKEAYVSGVLAQYGLQLKETRALAWNNLGPVYARKANT